MDPKQNAVQMVKAIMNEWGVNEADAKAKDKEGLWYFIQGSAHFHIELFTMDGRKGKVDAIEVGAIIMNLPADKAKKDSLFLWALQMNSTSCGVWFAVRGNLLMLLANRELDGLDMVEFRTMVDDVRVFADHFDDKLKTDYGDFDRGPAQ